MVVSPGIVLVSKSALSVEKILIKINALPWVPIGLPPPPPIKQRVNEESLARFAFRLSGNPLRVLTGLACRWDNLPRTRGTGF